MNNIIRLPIPRLKPYDFHYNSAPVHTRLQKWVGDEEKVVTQPVVGRYSQICLFFTYAI